MHGVSCSSRVCLCVDLYQPGHIIQPLSVSFRCTEMLKHVVFARRGAYRGVSLGCEGVAVTSVSELWLQVSVFASFSAYELRCAEAREASCPRVGHGGGGGSTRSL